LRPGRNEIKAYLRRAAPVEAIRIGIEGSDRAARLNSTRLFAPAIARADPWPKLPPDTVVDCALGGNGDSYLAGAWYPAEPSLRWSQSDRGELRLLAEFGGRDELRFWARCRVVGTPALGPISVRVCLPDEAEIAVWTFADENWRLMSLRLAPPLRGRSRQLRFRLARDATPSPYELGLAPDARKLGIAVRGFGLFSADAEESNVAAAFALL
jgi:hypothetical protein